MLNVQFAVVWAIIENRWISADCVIKRGVSYPRHVPGCVQLYVEILPELYFLIIIQVLASRESTLSYVTTS